MSFGMGDAYAEAPVEKIRLFHKIERELYSILVFELERDPKLSIKTIAFWIWLEKAILQNILPKILPLNVNVINGLVDEAELCVRCITEPFYMFSSTDESEISLSQIFLWKSISLKYFHENRVEASCGIKMLIDKVYENILNDLMEMAIKRNTKQQLLKRRRWQVVPPHLAQPTNPITPTFDQLRLKGESSRSMVPPLHLKVSKGNRSMFVTFSKGFPVSEWELRAFFNRMFGNCVESISMQIVGPGEQSLFAVVVFSTPTIIGLILSGIDMAKFSVKGKQVWMRKFISKALKPSQVD